MDYQKFLNEKQAIDFIANDNFSLVKVKPFEETIIIIYYRKIGSVWSRDAEYLLYDPGIETSYNFRRASGVAGIGGRCGLQHKISEVEALLSNAVSAVSVFYSKPSTDLWYICKEACMVSFPLDVLKSDLHGFVEAFYKRVEKP